MGKLSLNLCIQKRDENTGQGFPQPPVHKVWEPLKCCAAEIACSINCSKCCCLSSFRCTEGFGNKTLLVYSLGEEEAVASNCQELHVGAGPAVVQLPPPARCRYFLNMSCFGFFFSFTSPNILLPREDSVQQLLISGNLFIRLQLVCSLTVSWEC